MATLQGVCKQAPRFSDGAALDCAIENGTPYGGWCPKGRLAEDGPIDARYDLTETPTSGYPFNFLDCFFQDVGGA